MVGQAGCSAPSPKVESVRELAPILIAAATPIAGWLVWWIAVGYAEKKAAEAEADGVEDWQDLFWPRMLQRLDIWGARYSKQHMERRRGNSSEDHD